MEMADHLLTLREVEKLLRLGHSKVAELIANGRLQSLKIGRSRRVRRSDLDDFIRTASISNGDGDDEG